jgi:hypothetical protein
VDVAFARVVECGGERRLQDLMGIQSERERERESVCLHAQTRSSIQELLNILESLTFHLDYLREEFATWMPDREVNREGKVCTSLCIFFSTFNFLSLQIHATLFKSKHTNERKSGSESVTQSRRGIDCTEIFKVFGSHSFGEFQLDCLHLSQRFVYEKDGYYKCIHKILFP